MSTNKKCVSLLGPAVLTTGIFKTKGLRASYLAERLRCENLPNLRGGRRNLREQAEKIEGALKELERTSEEYE